MKDKLKQIISALKEINPLRLEPVMRASKLNYKAPLKKELSLYLEKNKAPTYSQYLEIISLANGFKNYDTFSAVIKKEAEAKKNMFYKDLPEDNGDMYLFFRPVRSKIEVKEPLQKKTINSILKKYSDFFFTECVFFYKELLKIPKEQKLKEETEVKIKEQSKEFLKQILSKVDESLFHECNPSSWLALSRFEEDPRRFLRDKIGWRYAEVAQLMPRLSYIKPELRFLIPREYMSKGDSYLDYIKKYLKSQKIDESFLTKKFLIPTPVEFKGLTSKTKINNEDLKEIIKEYQLVVELV